MKKQTTKDYRVKPKNPHLSKVVGWPKPYHFQEKKTVWQTIRAMLF